MKNLVFLLIISVSIFACAGTESLGLDKTPPEKPTMIPHLGDSGDTIDGIADYSFYFTTELEENGIDAVSDGNKIKIEWEHLLDNDLDYIRIHRFTEQDYLADSLAYSTIIDSINYVGVDNYKDNFTNDYHVTGKNWFYFIETFDTSGNSTFSDTVCYRLLEKTLVQSPSEFTEVNSMNEVDFIWNLSGAQYYKILVFDSEREIIWSYQPLDLEDTNIPYGGAEVPSGDYIIRIDAFGYQTTSTPINGKTYQILAGAESEERAVIVQ